MKELIEMYAAQITDLTKQIEEASEQIIKIRSGENYWLSVEDLHNERRIATGKIDTLKAVIEDLKKIKL